MRGLSLTTDPIKFRKISFFSVAILNVIKIKIFIEQEGVILLIICLVLRKKHVKVIQS